MEEICHCLSLCISPWGGGGGELLPYSFWKGVCRWVRESATLYQTKFCKFCDRIPIFCEQSRWTDPILDQFSTITRPYARLNGMKTIPFPVAHTRIANKKRSIVMAVCGWVVAMTFVVVDFATRKQPQKYTTIESVGSCVQFVQKTGSPKLYYVLPIICIAVPSITIVTCYIKIYQTIRQHNTAAAPSAQGGHSSYGVEEAKITRMLTVVVVEFCLCWPAAAY